MARIKKVWIAWLLSLVLLWCTVAPAAAEESGAAWGTINQQTAVVYLQGAANGAQITVQIGNQSAEVVSAKALTDLEEPIHTTIVLDNSLSIPKNQRPQIQELLELLIGNRLNGERFSIVTIDEQPNYLCQNEADYLQLKNVIGGITFQNQDTNLTDCLYRILQQLQQEQDDSSVFQRIILIADGVDDQKIGYTREELSALVQSCGYPLYTVGCSNSAADGNTQLQNLFALSRLTSGTAHYLAEEPDTTALAQALAAWNSAVQVTVALPDDVCDGSKRMLRLAALDSNAQQVTYLTELVMPFADLAPVGQPSEAPAEKTTPTAAPNQQESMLPHFFFPAVVILPILGLIGLAGVMLVRRKKAKEKFEYLAKGASVKSEPHVPGEDKTVMISEKAPDGATPTISIWDDPIKRRLILVDQNDAMRRYEVPLCGVVAIGRDPAQCQVVIEADPTVARHQCDIYLDPNNQIMIANQSKSNITQVNGQRVDHAQVLPDGAELTMGRTHLRVEIH